MIEIKIYTKVKSLKPRILEEKIEGFHIEILDLDHCPDDDFYFIYDELGLGLKSNLEGIKEFLPLRIDILDNLQKFKKQFLSASINKDALYKAFDFKNLKNQHILDCTAGMGKDLSLLLFFGGEVTTYERNPYLYLLLKESQILLLKETKYQVTLHFGDARQNNDFFDGIYFDPMFPEKKKDALPPKEMQFLKKMLDAGDDADLIAKELLTKRHFKRLIIKRPHWAGPLVENKTMSIESKLIRFDCYLNN